MVAKSLSHWEQLENEEAAGPWVSEEPVWGMEEGGLAWLEEGPMWTLKPGEVSRWAELKSRVWSLENELNGYRVGGKG